MHTYNVSDADIIWKTNSITNRHKFPIPATKQKPNLIKTNSFRKKKNTSTDILCLHNNKKT